MNRLQQEQCLLLLTTYGATNRRWGMNGSAVKLCRMHKALAGSTKFRLRSVSAPNTSKYAKGLHTSDISWLWLSFISITSRKFLSSEALHFTNAERKIWKVLEVIRYHVLKVSWNNQIKFHDVTTELSCWPRWVGSTERKKTKKTKASAALTGYSFPPCYCSWRTCHLWYSSSTLGTFQAVHSGSASP